MKKYLVPTFIALVMVQAACAHEGDVSTDVAIGGGVTYFEEEDHPTKMAWDNWTFCWGADAKSKTENLNSKGDNARGRVGALEDTLRVGGPLGHMLVSKMEWDTQFDKKDMVFKINIRRQVGANRYAETRSTCTTRNWRYKVNKLTAKVNTKVDLRVPPNVYVMRIKTLSNGSGHDAIINRVRAMPIQENAAVRHQANFALNGYQYFFTRPGEDFTISLDIDENQVKKLDVVASYEVTFVGQNRCDQAVRDLFGNSPLITTRDLRGRAREALAAVENGLSEDSGHEELHKAVLFIGCLMNRDLADGILYNNDAGQVQGLLTEFLSFERQVNNKINSMDSYKRIGDAMKLLTHMAIASLQANVLDSVKPYCEKLPVFDRSNGAQVGLERGFIKIGRNLKMARELLGNNGFSSYYARLLEIFRSATANGRPYDQILNDGDLRSHVIELAKLFDANSKVLVAHKITGFLAELPNLRPTATTVRLAQSAQTIEVITARLHSRFAREIDRFVSKSAKVPDDVDMNMDIRKLSEAETEFHDSATRLIQLVDSKEGGYVTSEFTRATEGIVTSGTNGWLAKVYNGYFADYLEGLDPDFKAAREAGGVDDHGNYERKAISEVQKCLVGFSSNND